MNLDKIEKKVSEWLKTDIEHARTIVFLGIVIPIVLVLAKIFAVFLVS